MAKTRLQKDQLPEITEDMLPEVNIFPLFDPAYFKVGTNGLMQPVDAAPSLPKPAAPTCGVVDDTANTFAVTPPTGYESAQLETSIDGGSTWANNPSLNGAFVVGNVDKAIGQVITRVKAVTDVNQAGFGLANATAFTAESGGGLVDYTGPYDQFENITQDGNSHVHVPGSGNFGFSRSQKVFPYGTPFKVTFDANPTKGTGVVIVSTGTGITPIYEQVISMYWARNTDTNGRFKGSTFTDELNDYSDVTISGSTPIGRIWSDGTELFADKSFDGGATFTEIDASKTIVWPSGQDLRLKTFFDQSDDKTIPNMKQEGLT